MHPLIDILAAVKKWRDTRKVTAALTQSLDLADTLLATLEKQCVQLQAEKDALQKAVREAEEKNRDLHVQLAQAKTPENLVELHGLLWRRVPAGGLSPTPLCPKCREILSTIAEDFPFFCERKHFKTHLCPMDAPAIIRTYRPPV